MVLESIITPLKAEKRPWEMILLGFVYASIGIFLSLWIFAKYASLVMVFLTVMACMPLMYATMKYEEEKDLKFRSESRLLREHGRALAFFMCLFIGMSLGFAFWYICLPRTMISSIFSIQRETIISINNQMTGNASQQLSVFTKIFLNNVKVLIFCIMFAFMYGLGAIFILTWNASVIGVAIGNFIRTRMQVYAQLVGLQKVAAYLKVCTLSILRYSVHGFPEILAYFIGGLAGGIISVAVIRHHFGTRKFEQIILDSSGLIILAVFMLIVAAFLEVFVTPAIVQ